MKVIYISYFFPWDAAVVHVCHFVALQLSDELNRKEKNNTGIK